MRLNHPTTPGYSIDIPAAAAASYLADGWTNGSPSVVAAAEPDTVGDLNTMTVAQLRELAAARGVELPAKAKKADILEALAQADPAGGDDVPSDPITDPSADEPDAGGAEDALP